jgi:hypothetical protein
MKKIFGFLGIFAVLVAAGCDYKGVPVAFAKTCDKANDDTTVEVVGFFNNTGSSMCSSSGNSPMRCPINFVETANGDKNIVRSDIDLGSGASSVENVEGKGLTIHDINGEVVENTTKVKVTANVNVIEGGYDDKNLQGCYVTVKKIEKVK